LLVSDSSVILLEVSDPSSVSDPDSSSDSSLLVISLGFSASLFVLFWSRSALAPFVTGASSGTITVTVVSTSVFSGTFVESVFVRSAFSGLSLGFSSSLLVLSLRSSTLLVDLSADPDPSPDLSGGPDMSVSGSESSNSSSALYSDVSVSFDDFVSPCFYSHVLPVELAGEFDPFSEWKFDVLGNSDLFVDPCQVSNSSGTNVFPDGFVFVDPLVVFLSVGNSLSVTLGDQFLDSSSLGLGFSLSSSVLSLGFSASSLLVLSLGFSTSSLLGLSLGFSSSSSGLSLRFLDGLGDPSVSGSGSPSVFSDVLISPSVSPGSVILGLGYVSVSPSVSP